MAINNKKQWIVLMHKAAKGPFTTEEVERLLEDKVLTRNDLAFKVAEGSPQAVSGWKMLWQFSEFERRKPKTGVPAPDEVTVEEERRKAKSDTEQRKQILSKLPPDLSGLDPEDLMLKAEKKIPDPLRSSGSNLTPPASNFRRYLPRVLSGVFILIAVGYLFIIFQTSNPKAEKKGLDALRVLPQDMFQETPARPKAARQSGSPLDSVRLPSSSDREREAFDPEYGSRTRRDTGRIEPGDLRGKGSRRQKSERYDSSGEDSADLSDVAPIPVKSLKKARAQDLDSDDASLVEHDGDERFEEAEDEPARDAANEPSEGGGADNFDDEGYGDDPF